MGARGPGAKRQRQVAAQAVSDVIQPWEAENLTRAERVIAFIESLPITKGFGAGENIKLLPFQRDWIMAIYATDDDGKRRVRTGLMSVGRGRGKTVLAAMLCLCYLCVPEAEQSSECYSRACSLPRWKLSSFRPHGWRHGLTCSGTTSGSEDDETGSVYPALASDGAAIHARQVRSSFATNWPNGKSANCSTFCARPWASDPSP